MTVLPTASVVIPTRNRRDVLRQCIGAVLAQSVPVEIIVVDDGSTDGTKEMVEGEFPQVRYRFFDGPNGPSFIRNKGSEMATGTILFPIDDDAIMVSRETVEQTLRDFNDARIGAVAIPYINVQLDQTVNQRAPAGSTATWLTEAYVGASHAVRRDVFLNLGGYREHLFYMGEEGDFCIRMLVAGHFVRLGTAEPIHHQESKKRATWRMDYYGRRNDVLYAWQNVPMPAFLPHLVGTILNGLLAARRAAHPVQMICGLLVGVLGIVRFWNKRKPVPMDVYRLSRRLKKEISRPLSESI